jgi:hypothetical protein
LRRWRRGKCISVPRPQQTTVRYRARRKRMAVGGRLHLRAAWLKVAPTAQPRSHPQRSIHPKRPRAPDCSRCPLASGKRRRQAPNATTPPLGGVVSISMVGRISQLPDRRRSVSVTTGRRPGGRQPVQCTGQIGRPRSRRSSAATGWRAPPRPSRPRARPPTQWRSAACGVSSRVPPRSLRRIRPAKV